MTRQACKSQQAFRETRRGDKLEYAYIICSKRICHSKRYILPKRPSEQPFVPMFSPNTMPRLFLAISKNITFPCSSKPVTLPTLRNHKLASQRLALFLQTMLISIQLLVDRLAHVRAIFISILYMNDHDSHPFQRRIPGGNTGFRSRRSPGFESAGAGEAVGTVVRVCVTIRWLVRLRLRVGHRGHWGIYWTGV
jgi:hypothetical protein